jgi:hypothetical protein
MGWSFGWMIVEFDDGELRKAVIRRLGELN